MDTPDSTPHIPSSDDADTDVQSTPGGLAEELEHEADERDAVVGPDAADAADDTDDTDAADDDTDGDRG